MVLYRVRLTMNNLINALASFGIVKWDLVLGGFGLFLFGIKFMGDGLKAVAGDKIRTYIDRYTSKVWMAIGIGAFITVAVQSSSATTAITIGFVRAGLMRLEQATGIIMGANIGTTVTSFLIGLKIENFAMAIIFVGAMLVLFAKKKRTNYIGTSILGFGIMFFGLKTMGDALKTLKDVEAFIDLTQEMSSNPFLALGGGIVFTGLVQSSSAMIGIVQKIYESGGMTIDAALPFVFGSNIGTTITAIMAALGGSLASKRAAGIHTLFNVLGTVFAMLFLNQFLAIDKYLTQIFNLNAALQVSVAHIAFNVVATLLMFPFVSYLVKLIRILIKGDEIEYREIDLNALDLELARSLPSAALQVSKNTIIKMGELSLEAIDETKQFLLTKSKSHIEHVLNLESIINNMDSKITDYLLVIVKENLGESDVETYQANIAVLKNIERIGDLATNLVEYYDSIYEADESFSQEALDDIVQMCDLVHHMIARSLRVFMSNDKLMHQSILEDENYLDLLEFKAKQRHFERMATDRCLANVGGSLFVDILATIERMGDHACNISKTTFSISVEHEVENKTSLQ
jgi:phosphate:Na+ symporter